MATFYERACKMGAWWGAGGGSLDLTELRDGLVLYIARKVDASYVAATCVGNGSALTAPQLAELDALLATSPKNVLAPCNALVASTWADTISAILSAGRQRNPGFTTEALVKQALGV